MPAWTVCLQCCRPSSFDHPPSATLFPVSPTPPHPRSVFELVAEAKSEETFVALCLLTVTGASLLTQRMGFSDTLGAFVAGVLLSGEVPSTACPQSACTGHGPRELCKLSFFRLKGS